MMRHPYNEREVKYVIAQCDFFVGARMDACIATLSRCVPTAAMAYSGKFTGVLQSVDMDSSIIDLRGLAANPVLAALGCSFEARDSHKVKLRQRIPVTQAVVLNLFRGLQ